MYCTNCGAKNDDKSNFCYKCGKKLIESNNEDIKENIEKNNFSAFAVTGFVSSLIGIVFFDIVFITVSSITGLCFSFFALDEIKKKGKKGKGLAIAGLVISIVLFTIVAGSCLL